MFVCLVFPIFCFCLILFYSCFIDKISFLFSLILIALNFLVFIISVSSKLLLLVCFVHFLSSIFRCVKVYLFLREGLKKPVAMSLHMGKTNSTLDFPEGRSAGSFLGGNRCIWSVRSSLLSWSYCSEDDILILFGEGMALTFTILGAK